MSEETLAATIKYGPIRFIYGWAGSEDERRGRIVFCKECCDRISVF